MNLSGKAVRYWMNELKIQPENLLVISDDLNIPFGTLRLRKNGSAGGHNGLTNITELIGTQEYARIRVGIGNDFGRGQQVGYVLGELSAEEKAEMAEKVVVEPVIVQPAPAPKKEEKASEKPLAPSDEKTQEKIEEKTSVADKMPEKTQKTPIVDDKKPTAEPIKDGFNGFISDGTPEDIARIIDDALSDKIVLANIGENAKRTMSTSWREVAEKMIEIYK
jgi:hypothetical protein